MNSPLNFEVLIDKQYRPMEGDFIIRSALKMSVSDLAETLPLNLCLVIDCSSSMRGEKIKKARESAINLANNLREEDLLTVVAFSSEPEVLVERLAGSDRNSILDTINSISYGGVTRMDLALESAYEVLNKSTGDYMPILILLSDGAPTDDMGNLLEESEKDKLKDKISAAFKLSSITTSTVGLGNASQCLASFLEVCADSGAGKFYFAMTPEVLADRFNEELQRVKATAISEVKFTFSDLFGKIRKAALVHPDVRELELFQLSENSFEINGGTLQKGEDQIFLTEIITPSHLRDIDKKLLFNVKAIYSLEGEEYELEGQSPVIEYTNDEDLLQKSGHSEVEKYKDMYKVFIQTQKAAQDIRSGADTKKTQILLQSAAKTTRKLGMSKQTKLLETLGNKVANGTATENDITTTSVGSRKTKVLNN
ncbi:Ca-activated chloride channel homolog [Candidatus Magnetomoraceae bacterium gMMP-1]